MRRRCAESPAAKALGARLEQAERRYGLLAGAGSVLVACSGGPDSVALLHLLWTLREDLGLRLGVAHFNHLLRPEAEADRDYVAGLAESLGLPQVSGKTNVTVLARERKLSLEAAAREARYSFLQATAAQGGWERVALGHTASDRAETVLMNLLRGSGVYGLRGIPARRGPYVRPLLLAWRQETEAYCAEAGLDPRRDATNLNPALGLRNRVRLELLPLLREQYSPRVDEALARLAEAVDAELEWTEPQVEQAVAQAVREGPEGVVVNLAAARELPPGLRYRLWRRVWEQASGTAEEFSSEALAALEDLLRRPRVGRQAHLGGDLRTRMGYNELLVAAGESDSPGPPPTEVELVVGGEVELPGLGRAVRLEELPSPPPELGQARERQIVVDAARAALPLCVRPWRAGDRLLPLGAEGHRKVQDLFTDLKVPADQRRRVPLVVAGDGRIVWVVGCAMSDEVKVTPATRTCLRLTVLGMPTVRT